MKERKLRSIKCECERKVSIRALSRHLKGKTYHSTQYIDKTIKFIELGKLHRWAWKISEGVEGKRDDYWCAKVLNEELAIEDLTFNPPRPRGQNSPSILKKISTDRKGKNNPSVKNKPNYKIADLRAFSMAFFEENENSVTKYPDFLTKIRENFPNYGYSLIGKWENGKRPVRGYSKDNLIISLLTDKKIEQIIEQRRADRGKFIQIGQRKSPNFQKIQNAGRKTIRGFVTIPHNTLYNMILSVDPDAKK
jgi:hypothetical protein